MPITGTSTVLAKGGLTRCVQAHMVLKTGLRNEMKEHQTCLHLHVSHARFCFYDFNMRALRLFTLVSKIVSQISDGRRFRTRLLAYAHYTYTPDASNIFACLFSFLLLRSRSLSTSLCNGH